MTSRACPEPAINHVASTRASFKKIVLQSPQTWWHWILQALAGKPKKHLYELSFEAEHLQLLTRIAHLSTSCRNLAVEVRSKSERYLERFSDSTRPRVNDILATIPAADTFTERPAISRELLQQNLRSVGAPADATTISAALSEWRKALLEQNEFLLRLQRYVSLAISKLPVKQELTSKVNQSKTELTRAQQLNMEIVACELLLGREEVASLPSNIQIEPTNRCNARCKSCSHRSPVGWSYHDMELATLDKLHHVLSIAQFVEIFGLGEATISPSFSNIAELCSNGVSETHVITNGTMLVENPDIGKLNKIGISFDGATKETFETLRVGIDFDRLITSIRKFRVQHPEIFIYFTATISRANIHEIPMMARLCRDLDLQAMCFHRMSTGVPELLSAVLTQEDMPEYKRKIEEGKRELEGSNVKLFDYLIAEQLPSSEEPLDPEKSLVSIKSFTVKKEHFSGDLTQVIRELKSQTIPYPLLHSSIELLQAPRPEATSTSASESPSTQEEQPIDRSLDALKKRAAALKDEVLAQGPSKLKIPYCLAAWYRLYVKADGNLVPCCTWSYGYSNINAVSNFNESWNGSFQKMLRRGFHGRGDLTDACKHCISIDRYQGMTELLMFLRSLGISYEDVPKQEGFNPPEGKLQL